MSTDQLNAIARRLLELPELLGQAWIVFLQRRIDRDDWIAADEPDIIHLAIRLLGEHLR